jgi:hypothetical protein
VPQVALNWLLQRPTVSSVVVGARDETQLRQNLGAVGWNLTPAQVAELDAASATTRAYPYWHQQGFLERNPESGLGRRQPEHPLLEVLQRPGGRTAFGVREVVALAARRGAGRRDHQLAGAQLVLDQDARRQAHAHAGRGGRTTIVKSS